VFFKISSVKKKIHRPATNNIIPAQHLVCLLRNRSCNRRILRSVSCSTRAFSVGSAASCFNSLEMGTPAGRDHHLTAVQWHSLLYTACTFPERLVHRLVRRHCQISFTSSQYFSFVAYFIFLVSSVLLLLGHYLYLRFRL